MLWCSMSGFESRILALRRMPGRLVRGGVAIVAGGAGEVGEAGFLDHALQAAELVVGQGLGGEEVQRPASRGR